MNDSYRAPQYTVFDIYQTVFGYRAQPFPQGAISGFIQSPAERLSKLGAVLFKRDANGSEAFCPVVISHNGKKYELPYSTISVGMRKRIESTPMPGRKGTVKELINIEDYVFTIQGIVLGEDLPEEELRQLDELFNINEPVKLENAFSEIFLQRDNTVVIETADYPDMRGVIGAQAYSFKVVSDTILELEEV